jgi:hypothetical protein
MSDAPFDLEAALTNFIDDHMDAPEFAFLAGSSLPGEPCTPPPPAVHEGSLAGESDTPPAVPEGTQRVLIRVLGILYIILTTKYRHSPGQ